MNKAHNNDIKYMQMAIKEAEKAYENQEVPVGAVLVLDERIIARSHNMRESFADPTAHAEILILREAARRIGTWRLSGAIVYSTLEPCCMCAGAMINARIERLVYGAADPKSGACVSVIDLFNLKELNHKVETTGKIMEKESLKLLRDFFRNRRN